MTSTTRRSMHGAQRRIRGHPDTTRQSPRVRASTKKNASAGTGEPPADPPANTRKSVVRVSVLSEDRRRSHPSQEHRRRARPSGRATPSGVRVAWICGRRCRERSSPTRPPPVRLRKTGRDEVRWTPRFAGGVLYTWSESLLSARVRAIRVWVQLTRTGIKKSWQWPFLLIVLECCGAMIHAWFVWFPWSIGSINRSITSNTPRGTRHLSWTHRGDPKFKDRSSVQAIIRNGIRASLYFCSVIRTVKFFRAWFRARAMFLTLSIVGTALGERGSVKQGGFVHGVAPPDKTT